MRSGGAGRRVVSGVLLMLGILLATAGCRTAMGPRLDLVDEVVDRVEQDFFDADFNGADWPVVRERAYMATLGTTSDDQMSAILNELLGELKTSHTAWYDEADAEYYELLDIFKPIMSDEVDALFWGDITYTTIGIQTMRVDGDVFVRSILDGSPAREAGLAVGDRIVTIERSRYHARRAFADRAGEPVTLQVQSNPDPDSIHDIVVVPEQIIPGDAFRRAQQQSVELVQTEAGSVGYVHVWNFAGGEYEALLMEQLSSPPLADADVLVLDLRDGWGGANPQVLNVFNPDVPKLLQIGRTGALTPFDPQWRKPVVLLVNEGTRSGKEVLAYGFQAYELGPVVGARTAGAVVGGRPYVLSDGSLLYLAVQDVLVDGQRLEGVGVEPDVLVPFEIPWSNGADPQRQRALEVAQELLAG